MPVTALRTSDSSRKDATYVALMCSRPARHTITAPRIQITTIGQITLPHWMLRTEALAGARNSSALTPKFDGFHRCRSRKRKTYFVAIETRLVSAYAHRNGDRTRIPTLMPVMYALAGCGQRPYVRRPITSSAAIATRIATPV